ncbi:DNA cytosine methyltransferase [Marinobacter nauticus]|uniref:DNA cytosine methyltransferase n=1 Tax=Marinobacter nauticus TaxID=2743 RepID=UPI001C58DFDE|nr:DNA (cytosine-5-)-methyltransferase [Marinobacter nauticus]MBW3196764.1 DNA (cytosine-5-)-methyltransferase [Marinobacter nauticus]MBY6182174.1 DNA (cytosine-5-)-methyltransferase [Marinobacter nauticus]
MTDTIKVIDLFAGPGGLGEGFSAFKTPDGTHPFKIVASVEKEASAHKTLTLRAFYRQFLGEEIPPAYYEYLRGSPKISAEQFFSEKFPEKWAAAKRETLGGPKALGSEDHDEIFQAIKEQIAGHVGKKIVIGGPPCQAYSLVGRARNKGIKGYVAEEDHRHFLYKEYLKVLDLVQPDIFVMENVKGILTAKVNDESIFEKIREDLACPARALGSIRKEVEYELLPFAHPLDDLEDDAHFHNKDFIIRAEEYGIPQARHRVIVLGVRRDIRITGEMQELLSRWKSEDRITPEMILSDLPPLRSGLTRSPTNDFHTWKNNLYEAFSAILDAEKLPDNMKKIAQNEYLSVSSDLGQGGRFVSAPSRSNSKLTEELKKWYLDKELKGFVNHQARNHMPKDLHRYFFASCYAAASKGISPKAQNYPDSLEPAHRNWKSGNFADRFKVQAKERVASTVTSHISKDGHYFIHYDPSQCRSLTVREAARIQTFPDNYFFEGNRTEQFVQVGNAVPPLLANRIATKVFELLAP